MKIDTQKHITTVTYGLKCVPFLVLRYLQQLIEDDSSRFLKAIAPLNNGKYVDEFSEEQILSRRQEKLHVKSLNFACQVVFLCKSGTQTILNCYLKNF